MTEKELDEVARRKAEKVERVAGRELRPNEKANWRGYDWHVVDARNDGDHVHLTLTVPELQPYRPTTNDG